MDATTPARGRPGRKRSEESRTAILAAAYALIGEVGYARLTVDAVAQRAGCGKQTIYRWWPTKAHVLLEALAVEVDLNVSTDDHGSYAADLRAFLADSLRMGTTPAVVAALRALMAEAQIDDAFGAHFREAFLRRRRQALQRILDRAAARGDLPASPAQDNVPDIVFGTLWYRILTDRPLSPAGTDELAALLTHMS